MTGHRLRWGKRFSGSSNVESGYPAGWVFFRRPGGLRLVLSEVSSERRAFIGQKAANTRRKTPVGLPAVRWLERP